MINWIKSHLLVLFLIIIVLFLVTKSFFGIRQAPSVSSLKTRTQTASTGVASPQFAPAADIDTSSERLVIQDTNLSLVVKDVSLALLEIENKTKEFGGYLVSSVLVRPESAASGNITIRVPENKRSEALSAFKKSAIKTVSESVYGNDVTDEYVDLESRLAILNQTKTKYQEILTKAYTVTDLLNVQRELSNLQTQMDNLKGQQKFYEQSAKMSRVVIYLSTDELSLPYAPTTEWRPTVVLKTAVRSLIGTARSLANLIIWIAVYSPLIILIYLGYRLIRRRH